MVTRTEFNDQVKDALNHLYDDYSHLNDHPVARLFWPVLRGRGPTRAQRLHRLLLETIEDILPPTQGQQNTSRATAYILLVRRYVDELSIADIEQELAVSRRQFYREQARAISILAAALWSKRPVAAIAEVGGQEDLLEAEAGRVLTERALVDLDGIVKSTLQVVAHLAEAHGVALEYAAPAELPAVYGSRTLLRQILLSSLNSMISHDISESICLRLGYEGRQLSVELCSVHKKPAGSPPEKSCLSPEDIGRLRHLVEIAGGCWEGLRVEAANCTCRFALPCGSADVLLVIDDNEAVIEGFRRQLAAHQYLVLGVIDASEAVGIACEASPKAITLDVMMPGQDGWEVLQALKSHPSTQGIPVIICSVLEDPELAYSLGAQGYLRKPVSQIDLLRVLDDVI